MKNKGSLFVISGPSGCGKGTVLNSFFDICEKDNVFLSISSTTRAPRDGEVEGVNYYYKSKSEFEDMIKNDALLEWACFCDNYYGTPKDEVFKMLSQGKDVILEIEVQGAMKVKQAYPDCILIFVYPPSFKELENRISGRQTESEDVIRKRLETAKWEFENSVNYDYILLNDDVEAAALRLKTIVDAQRYKVKNNLEFIKEVF